MWTRHSHLLPGLGLALLASFASADEPALDCVRAGDDLLFVGCAGAVEARLVMLDEASGVPMAAPEEAGEVLIVTGAYTSGERREPEGLFIVEGDAHDPHPQGWDGLALIDGRGVLSLHYVGRVSLDGTQWNLRERAGRRAFAAAAAEGGWSAMQSHLLVINGAVDTSPIADAPRFRRRILFSRADGTVGVFDSRARALTLHEAAEEIAERFAPVMAFNLDMGSYDLCYRAVDGREQRCGVLTRESAGKLSNILVLRRTDAAGEAALRAGR